MLTGKPPWSAKYDEIVDLIGDENALPEIPGSISREARDFLMGCFVRNPRFRWTASADMLFCHPFLSNLPEEEDDEVVDVDIERLCLSAKAKNGEFSSSSFAGEDDDDDVSVGYWSEEEEEDTEEIRVDLNVIAGLC